MGIQHYLREIGRGTRGARGLARAQAADLWGMLVDGQVSDLETGAFCVAMRFKGETSEELAGFLDASEQRLPRWPAQAAGVVVLPSYNGARKLPNLTPLLAALLAREGLAVLVHGSASEDQRVDTEAIWRHLDWPTLAGPAVLAPGQACWMSTGALLPALDRLLQLRRQLGLRNPAHSVVKLLDPLAAPDAGYPRGPASLVVGSYTHPEYARSMAETVALRASHALLLRGTEGEPVADLRRQAAMQGWLGGRCRFATPAQPRDLQAPLALPPAIDAASTARWTEDLLAGRESVPASIARQVQAIAALHRAMGQPDGQGDAALRAFGEPWADEDNNDSDNTRE